MVRTSRFTDWVFGLGGGWSEEGRTPGSGGACARCSHLSPEAAPPNKRGLLFSLLLQCGRFTLHLLLLLVRAPSSPSAGSSPPPSSPSKESTRLSHSVVVGLPPLRRPPRPAFGGDLSLVVRPRPIGGGYPPVSLSVVFRRPPSPVGCVSTPPFRWWFTLHSL